MQTFYIHKKIGGSLDAEPELIAAGTINIHGGITYDYWINLPESDLAEITRELRRYQRMLVGQNYHVHNPVTRLTIRTHTMH